MVESSQERISTRTCKIQLVDSTGEFELLGGTIWLRRKSEPRELRLLPQGELVREETLLSKQDHPSSLLVLVLVFAIPPLGYTCVRISPI